MATYDSTDYEADYVLQKSLQTDKHTRRHPPLHRLQKDEETSHSFETETNPLFHLLTLNHLCPPFNVFPRSQHPNHFQPSIHLGVESKL